MKQRVALPLYVLLTLVLPLGCDKATPVAPEGTTLQITASPSQIPTATGTSTITAVARRPNGTPVNPGTEIRFSTTLGTIEQVVTTDSSGVARATLRGDGRLGTATVTASSGATEAATVEIEIGSPARSLSLQATPTNLPETGGRVRLLASVRDAQGDPLSNVTVNFRTEVGRLDSRGAILRTDENGQVEDSVRVSAADLTSISGTSFTVSAQAAGAEGNLIEESFEIRIQSEIPGAPLASFNAERGDSEREVIFTNTSTGEGTLSFEWDFGDGTTSTARTPPDHEYSRRGTFQVTLEATSSLGSDTASCSVTVPIPEGETVGCF